jgi:hypothetical protein
MNDCKQMNERKPQMRAEPFDDCESTPQPSRSQYRRRYALSRRKAGIAARIQLGNGGRTRRLLLLAQANAFTRVGTGAGDTLDFRQAALRRGWHTDPGGGVLHITHGALGYRCRCAGRWYGEDGDRRGCRDRDRESTGKD